MSFYDQIVNYTKNYSLSCFPPTLATLLPSLTLETSRGCFYSQSTLREEIVLFARLQILLPPKEV